MSNFESITLIFLFSKIDKFVNALEDACVVVAAASEHLAVM